MQRGYRLITSWETVHGQSIITTNASLADRIEIISKNEHVLSSLTKKNVHTTKYYSEIDLLEYKNIYLSESEELYNMCISKDLEIRNLAAKIIENAIIKGYEKNDRNS